ncbi:MAG: threonine ammonia-lyase, biosynthetic [Deltaproteobacteria bacterium]|nr:threonine ammonia-lyase, biosynthetic [Deltaproteobacteria bacterium]
MQNLFKKVLSARVYDVAVVTPLDRAETLSTQLGNHIFLKREDLQPTFSFKIRGAANKVAGLNEAQRKAGVICASAGNHAQGVAISARHFGLKARVVMPVTTPQIKVDSVKRLGGEVILKGDSYSEAQAYCDQLVAETGGTFIHPFDDEDVIAGQGTIAHELLQTNMRIDAVFVPVGGGGLISGIASFLKEISPQTLVIGVEPEDSDAMTRSVKKGKRIKLAEVGLFADGVAVQEVGKLTFKMAQHYVDDFVTVSTDEICSGIKAVYQDTRAILEPSGALAVAGLRKYLQTHPMSGKNLVAINSGANMNFERLQFVAERTLVGEKQEALFAVTIPERPRALRQLCELVIQDRNITELHYRLSGRDDAHIFVGVAIKSGVEADSLSQTLDRHGFKNLDLTANELAKTHLRHMVGGKTAHAFDEVVYRFEFPERPNALGNFLKIMGENWNISLFHYRSHGGDFGRVLVGFEIPPKDKKQFREFLTNIRYRYVEETQNPAYHLFL